MTPVKFMHQPDGNHAAHVTRFQGSSLFPGHLGQIYQWPETSIKNPCFPECVGTLSTSDIYLRYFVLHVKRKISLIHICFLGK